MQLYECVSFCHQHATAIPWAGSVVESAREEMMLSRDCSLADVFVKQMSKDQGATSVSQDFGI